MTSGAISRRESKETLQERLRVCPTLMAFCGLTEATPQAPRRPAARGAPATIELRLPALSVTQILAYAYLSVAGALLAYALWFRGIARLSPVAVSSLGLLSPLTAVILGWALLGQTMTGLSLVGLLTVLGSVLAVQWASGSQGRTLAPQGVR